DLTRKIENKNGPQRMSRERACLEFGVYSRPGRKNKLNARDVETEVAPCLGRILIRIVQRDEASGRWQHANCECAFCGESSFFSQELANWLRVRPQINQIFGLAGNPMVHSGFPENTHREMKQFIYWDFGIFHCGIRLDAAVDNVWWNRFQQIVKRKYPA